jgi:hypothetical protein
MEPVLLVDLHDGWTTLTLNRPRLNALNAELHRALPDHPANKVADLLPGIGRRTSSTRPPLLPE